MLVAVLPTEEGRGRFYALDVSSLRRTCQGASDGTMSPSSALRVTQQPELGKHRARPGDLLLCPDTELWAPPGVPDHRGAKNAPKGPDTSDIRVL